MFSPTCSLLLALLLILQRNTTSSNELTTSFCLSTDTRPHTDEATTRAPQQEDTEEQRHTAPPQGRSRPKPEECCADFAFTLPSSKPSARRLEPRADCRQRVLMFKTISSLCEDHSVEWVPKVLRAHEWCLKKGFAPEQDSGEISIFTFNQFLDAVTPEACCYLFSQTPAKVFTTHGGKISNGCEQISFNVTVQTSTSDCTGNLNGLAHGFIRTTYNCLSWAF